MYTEIKYYFVLRTLYSFNTFTLQLLSNHCYQIKSGSKQPALPKQTSLPIITFGKEFQKLHVVKLEQSVVNFVQIKHYFVATECMIQLDVCGLLLNFTENSIETSRTNRSVSTSKFLSLTVFCLFVCCFLQLEQNNYFQSYLSVLQFWVISILFLSS